MVCRRGGVQVKVNIARCSLGGQGQRKVGRQSTRRGERRLGAASERDGGSDGLGKRSVLGQSGSAPSLPPAPPRWVLGQGGWAERERKKPLTQ